MPTKPRTVLTLGEDLDIGLAGVQFADGDFKHGFDLAIEEVKERYGDGLIIPLADGQQVVVEEKDMEVAREELYSLAYELVECGGDCTDGDVLRILSTLFPAGIVVAEGARHQFKVSFHGEQGAGLNPYYDDITIVVKSGNPGGDEGEFAMFMRDALAEWFDGASVDLKEAKP